MLEAITSGYFRCEHYHLMHMCHQGHCSTTPNSTTASHQQRTPWTGQYSVYTCHVVQNFFKYQNVKVFVFPACNNTIVQWNAIYAELTKHKNIVYKWHCECECVSKILTWEMNYVSKKWTSKWINNVTLRRLTEQFQSPLDDRFEVLSRQFTQRFTIGR